MTIIQWRPEYSLGNPDVDHEHQELIALINQLHDDLLQSYSDEAVQDFLGEIFASISAHFALEEKLMSDGGYEAFEEHKADHEQLLDDIRDMMDDYDDHAHADIERLSAELDQWFSGHFSNHDRRLHHWLG